MTSPVSSLHSLHQISPHYSRAMHRCLLLTQSPADASAGSRPLDITTRRITSGDELYRRNGVGGLALDLRFIQKG